jgi:aspartyl-tRNA(Asn)/glutamyl-tRNA(Gln) amidotransferase subunit C
MALTPADVDRMALLARLALGPEEKRAMLDQLHQFFGIVEAMSSVDTSGLEPLATPLSALQDDALRLRDDVVTQGDVREASQRSAPLVDGGLYLVPRVVE